MRHIVATAESKITKLSEVLLSMGAESFNAVKETIKNHLQSKPDGLQEIRTNEAVEEFLRCKNEALKENSRTRKKGVDLPSRAAGRISLSELKKTLHEDALLKEIQARHLVPYIVSVAKAGLRAQHPSPKYKSCIDDLTQQTCVGTRSNQKGANTKKVGLLWMDWINLLMSDEERLWTLENPDTSIDEFDSKSFVVRGEGVEFCFNEK